MKNLLLLLAILFATEFIQAQNITCFDYDVAGNRVKRYQCCTNCQVVGESQDRDDANSSKLEMKIIPNPNSGLFTLASDNIPSDATVQIVDMNGRIVLNRQFNSGAFDVSALPSGIYFVRITYAEKQHSIRMEKI